MNIDIYQYIAANDPVGSQAICNKYGYAIQNVQSSDDLASCLMDLVGEVGDPALTDIASIHPDLDLLVEKFGSAAGDAGSFAKPGGCGCGGDCGGDHGPASKKYLAEAGNQQNMFSVHQGGIFIIAATLILAVAIISNNKS